MQVMATSDERREHRREIEPSRQLTILVDGENENIVTDNWSMGGFCTHGLAQFNKKDRFNGIVAGEGERPDIPFVGKILRIEDDGARIVKMAEIELDHLLTLLEAVGG
mgnify:CR=1 FL=1|jgi:hypothetical protein